MGQCRKTDLLAVMVRRVKKRQAIEPVGEDPLDAFDYPRTQNPLERPEDDFVYSPVPRPSEKKNPRGLGIAGNLLGVTEPQSSLTPILGNIYATPGDAADPRDCDRFPNSPWCGGVGFSRDIAALDPSLVYAGDPEGKDPLLVCTIGANIDATLGFTNLPSFQVAWKNPDSRCAPKPKITKKSEKPETEWSEPAGFNRGIDGAATVYAFISEKFEYQENRTYLICDGRTVVNPITKVKTSLLDAYCPGQITRLPSGISIIPAVSDIFASYREFEDIGPFTGNCHAFWNGRTASSQESTGYYNEADKGDQNEIFIDEEGNPAYYLYGGSTTRTNVMPGIIATQSIKISLRTSYLSFGFVTGVVKGQWKAIQAFFRNKNSLLCARSQFSIRIGNKSSTLLKYQARCEKVYALGCKEVPEHSPAYLPPRGVPVDCCSELKEMVRLMITNLGVNEFPAQFAQGLTTDANKQETIANMALLLRKQVLYLDEIVGEYPTQITIEDTDPLKQGNQSETMEFGNVSEILTEHFGVSMNTSLDTAVLVQLSTKSLMEAGILRKQVHTLQSQIEALMAHQGFSYKEKTEKVPFTFSVPESEKITDFTLEKFVKESEQEVPVIKFTGDTTYQEDSMVLRKLWGVIKAVFWRNIAKDAASVAGEISKLIKNQNNTIDKITDNSVDNLQRYLEDFENGFTNGYTGGTTTQGKPFGLDYTLGVLL